MALAPKVSLFKKVTDDYNSSAGFSLGTTADAAQTFWFRLYNSKASFLSGPIGATGPAGPRGEDGVAVSSGNSAIPYEPVYAGACFRVRHHSSNGHSTR